jgi:general secretion pathway protein G
MNVATGTDHRSEGFTLIEIMAVVLIIGMLSGIVGFAVFQQVDKARVVTARAQIDRLESSLELYSMDNGRFPSTEQGLDALIHKPSGAPEPRNYQSGGYLKGGELPRDPWGNDFQYESPGVNNQGSFDLWSLGKDGETGGDELDADIGNWSDEERG